MNDLQRTLLTALPEDAAVVDQIHAIASAIPDPIFVIDYNGRYVNLIGGRERLLYDSGETLVGRYLRDIFPPAIADRFLAAVRRAINTQVLQTLEYTLDNGQVAGSRCDGPPGPQWFEARVAPMRPHLGEIPTAVWLALNITKRKAMEEELKRLASQDPLSEVANRRYFFELGHKEFLRARRHRRPLSVLMLDIDHFKNINDCFGHAVGDQAIRALADVCRTELRLCDHIGRLGGEEFAVLLPETRLDQAALVGERLRTRIAGIRLATGDDEVRFSGSIGVAGMSEDDDNIECVLQRADQCLYEAKRSGRNRVITDLSSDP